MLVLTDKDSKWYAWHVKVPCVLFSVNLYTVIFLFFIFIVIIILNIFIISTLIPGTCAYFTTTKKY